MPEIPIRAFLVSLVVLRKTDARHEVLLLERTQTLVGEWCQVSGSIEEGETAWQAALRELNEETGLKPGALYSADTCEQFMKRIVMQSRWLRCLLPMLIKPRRLL